ncbi:3-phosphoshikimate 1-carboxyvinyltransferase 1 [Flexivirga endophytica]|uniref:3-phosphoshikimate 1-carboxyvinyltransferase n=1 Tax=Flexivirga endophytica TaxID=1849103 RepID=A0A916WLZ5_9MICO|nr:3-phosphoshikimate 1-carboxyvinyltransferase [Flexivirga endophytica]GGB14729.1 3-phosphoshikimate 1-carboxyvinyltransferase 1 [Flexivirga endophytica]GHB65515.1 3-phosphoshikimate 1-carboxyvinyltransferase 1 [Flexivirga endophytica]
MSSEPPHPTTTATITAGDWAAPAVDRAVDAVVPVPGSKSLTNRFLVLAALAQDSSRLSRPLRSRDSTLMCEALQALGTRIDSRSDDTEWLIEPAPLHGPAAIDCGLAGTVMRFLPPVAALAEGTVAFDGDDGARRRPLGPVLGALRSLGVTVDGDGLPFTLTGTGRVTGGTVHIDASGSSQFVSALLLAGARYDDGITVIHDGKQVPSLPHIAMTVEVLRDAGVLVDDSEANRWRVEPSQIHALDVEVEPDLSNAFPFLAAALLTGGQVTVPGWPVVTTQAGDHARDILQQFGADVQLTREGLTVRGTGRVEAIDIDLHEASELSPVVAAIAAFADGPSHLRGIGHIRFHETDRLAALATELGRLGSDVEETEDGLVIRPKRMRGNTFHTYGDHRMVMAAAVLGLRVPHVVVEDAGTVAKTMPDFTARWTRMIGE